MLSWTSTSMINNGEEHHKVHKRLKVSKLSVDNSMYKKSSGSSEIITSSDENDDDDETYNDFNICSSCEQAIN